MSIGKYYIPNESTISTCWKKQPTDKGQFVSPEVTIEYEQCWTLNDYLRNKTFIHQSIANGGFGMKFENREKIKLLSENFLQKIGGKEVSFDAYFESQKIIDTLLNEACNE